MKSMIDPRRVRLLPDIFDEKASAEAQEKPTTPRGPVVYWMSRDQRIADNWAYVFAAQKANELNVPLHIVFALAPTFIGATLRQYDFMLQGLEQLEKACRDLNVVFALRLGSPEHEIPAYVKEVDATLMVTDFSPLRIGREWRTSIAKKIGEQKDVPFFEVDAHNIIPVWITSEKQEFAAYTIRPKIHRLLKEFLVVPPQPKAMNHVGHDKSHNKSHDKNDAPINWNHIRKQLKVDEKVGPVDWLVPGEKAAHKALKHFINNNIQAYATERNNPNKAAQSNLSPYLHFGQLAPVRVAYEVILASEQPLSALLDKDKNAARSGENSYAAYLEELIVRRELADNFCLYNPHYDTPEGFPDWAKKSHAAHARDKREYIYTLKEFETGATHDDLWNAAQHELIKTGKIHGYMRMYWAKKILEWTPTVAEAQHIAIHLNDKYELDGRDPNGYAGIAWSLGGVHDRAWFVKPVFGQIRYMNRRGSEGKFDVPTYISKWLGLF